MLILYGAIGVLADDLIVPTKSGAIHLHGLQAWVMACAILCAAAVIFSAVVDHYELSDNERSYKSFGKWSGRLGWGLAGMAMALKLARINYPEPSEPTTVTLMLGLILFGAFVGFGFANEKAIDRARRGNLPQAAAQYQGFGKSRLVGGLALLVLGMLLLLFVLPSLLRLQIFAFVLATIACLITVLGWVIFDTPSSPKARVVGDTAGNHWVKVRIGVLIVVGLWSIWYVKTRQTGNWHERDEVEKNAAPAWRYRFDDFAVGLSLEQIRARLTADGFNLRCYGNLEPREKLENDDTDVCWTLANNIEGISSGTISFHFGQDGIHQIRMELPRDRWAEIAHWVDSQGDFSLGRLATDMGGAPVIGRRGKTGITLVAEPRFMGWVMVLWRPRERFLSSNCQTGEFNERQWQLICREWPATRRAGPFDP